MIRLKGKQSMKYQDDIRYTFDFSDVHLKMDCFNVTLNNASHEPPRRPWDIPLHDHNSYEIHFIASGSGRFTVAGTDYDVTAGDVIITGPNILHAQTSGLDDPMEEYCINVTITKQRRKRNDCRDLSKLIDTISRHPFRICGKTDAEAEFVILLTEAMNRHAGWRERVSAMMASLLIRVGRLIDGSPDSDPETQLISDDYMTSRAVNRQRQIDRQLRSFLDSIDEDELGGSLFVSRRQLSRIMRECYSMTFTEKVNDLRAEYAKNLLVTTDMTVAEISDACGFSSVQYFYKVFARKYGTSPGKLRGKKTDTQIG